MCDIIHEINIDARPSEVFDAIITAKGLKSWWTAYVNVPEIVEPGSKLLFGFNERQVIFRMHVDEILRFSTIEWTCFGDIDEWTGTQLLFLIDEHDGNTNLRFIHSGWESAEGMFGVCNTTWGMLMYRLRDYLEGKSPGPYFE